MTRAGRGIFALDWPKGAPVRRVIESVFGLDRLERIHAAVPEGVTGEAFLASLLELLGVELSVGQTDLERLPKSGPAVVVSNHPFGGIEGVALARALRMVRPDVKILANFLLARIPELREFFLFVDPFAGKGSSRAHANAKAVRAALAWLEQGGLLAAFPAGEVASFDLKALRVVDPPWNPVIAGLARRAGAPVVPVYFPGRNRAIFQAAGLLHPLLRTAMLPREFLARQGKPIELRIGTPVPSARLDEFADDTQAIAYLRDRTEILAGRVPSKVASPAVALQPRRTPVVPATIVPPVPVAELAAEVASLPGEALLIESDEFEVYVSRAAAIPKILREIGRLREVTFREVGEGTGREIDLDAFDATYFHLFIWNRVAREVVGAYRLGPTDEILAAAGIKGLYTASLFTYDAKLFAAMGPALEMGRSWIRAEHQKSFTGLMLLWKGIGEFVGRHPHYATLFGPVSISAEYRSLSQRMIVAFLERNRKITDWSGWVRPTNPFREPRWPGSPRGPAHLADLEDVSEFISEIEADQKGAPILLKQYLRLDGRLLSYNVDPDFANVLDVLIVVDLRRTSERALQRYMGRDNLRGFRAFHGGGRLTVNS